MPITIGNTYPSEAATNDFAGGKEPRKHDIVDSLSIAVTQVLEASRGLSDLANELVGDDPEEKTYVIPSDCGVCLVDRIAMATRRITEIEERIKADISRIRARL